LSRAYFHYRHPYGFYIFSIELNYGAQLCRGQTTGIFGLNGKWDYSQRRIEHLFANQALPLPIALNDDFVRLFRADGRLAAAQYSFFLVQAVCTTNLISSCPQKYHVPCYPRGEIQAKHWWLHYLTELFSQWPGNGFFVYGCGESVDRPLISAYLLFVGACLSHPLWT